MSGGEEILEGIFKGLLQWVYDLILEIVEYIANALLDVFSMELSYFESSIPVVNDIIIIIIAAGWACSGILCSKKGTGFFGGMRTMVV